MVAGLPSPVEARLVYPERIVTAICRGDGFMMNLQEIAAANRRDLHIVVVILRDNANVMIESKSAIMKFKDFGLSSVQVPDDCVPYLRTHH